MNGTETPYLEPYRSAARKFGAGFGSLLWASPRTQRARFAAICQLADLRGKRVLDVGCGRADFLVYLNEQGIEPSTYLGIEAVAELADAAERQPASCDRRIIRADFVREPHRMFVGAEMVVFSGSLNTLMDDACYATLGRAYEAASQAVVFNFLCSTYLTGREYLFWRGREQVSCFAEAICPDVRFKDDYLPGDCTALLTKPAAARDETIRKG